MSLSTSPSVRVRASSLELTNHAVVTFVSALVFLPSAIFATSLKPLPAAAVISGCGAAMALVIGRQRDTSCPLGGRIDVVRLALAVGLAVVIFILGGETHLFYATPDWQIRDAVLSDLVAHGFPIAYRIDDADYLLRAPLGMYMLPALVGRGLGLTAAHVALLGQNAVVLGCIFYLMSVIGRGWAHLGIVILFAGLSLVGTLKVLAAQPPNESPFWLLIGLDAWHPYFQYSSSMVQFFWVPNHAMPGWWLALLLLMQRPSSPDVATVGVSVAGLALWSPLAVIPAVPWLLYVFARHWRQVCLSARPWLGAAASLGFLPILAYMVVASSSIAHQSLVEQPAFLPLYVMFIVLQLPALFFLRCVWADIPSQFRALVVINALVLLALPLYRFGPSNDLVMRGSIASLTIVAFVFGSVVVDLTRRRQVAGYVGCALVIAATPSALVEIGRSLSTPRYAISDCSLMEATRATGGKGPPANYVARVNQVPDCLHDVGAADFSSTTKKTCWPDRVLPRYFGITYKTVSKP